MVGFFFMNFLNSHEDGILLNYNSENVHSHTSTLRCRYPHTILRINKLLTTKCLSDKIHNFFYADELWNVARNVELLIAVLSGFEKVNTKTSYSLKHFQCI